MGFVPANRRAQARLRRQLGENLPVVVFGFGPVPLPTRVVADTPQDAGNVVHGETELVRALPRSRFRGAFGEQVVLPVSRAETLERFEAELRSVGLIRPNECLRQGAKLPSHFRVQVRHGKRPAGELLVHDLSSLKNARSGPLKGEGERAPKLRCSEPKPSCEPVSGEQALYKRKRPLVRSKPRSGTGA